MSKYERFDCCYATIVDKCSKGVFYFLTTMKKLMQKTLLLINQAQKYFVLYSKVQQKNLELWFLSTPLYAIIN